MAIDSTVGGIASNSYVSLAEAVAYFADRIHAGNWYDLSTNDREKVLITSTSIIDWYVDWKGSKTSQEQAREWPRTGVITSDGSIPSDVIPIQVKVAVYAFSLSSAVKDRVADGSLDGLSEVRASSLMIKTDDGVYNSNPSAIPDKIWKILQGLTVKGSSGVIRLIRA
jgi:hypothetical protein